MRLSIQFAILHTCKIETTHASITSSYLSTSQDDRVSVTPARVTEGERLQNYRAKKKEQKLQNNHSDAILTLSPVPLTNAERAKNYRERQKQKELGNNLDEIVASSPARVTEAERLRNYRAKKKEQKLQNNPDAILTLPGTVNKC
ncbi:unnamed protein product [Macrosiphum euphorbiae]|uniref:Uncharacterized protein n=1 Tax=Macrosiphum euphorbiae TaxID=13131 RepID=A0AAV0W0D0_9HEMI|nr:unnamed protein product [Macrosiphum euphorbiae]